MAWALSLPTAKPASTEAQLNKQMHHAHVCIGTARHSWAGLGTSRARPKLRASVAAKMDVVIDLTAQEEQTARRAIMAHASAVLATQHAARSGLKGDRAAGNFIDLATDSEGEEVQVVECEEPAAPASRTEAGTKRHKQGSPTQRSSRVDAPAQPQQEWPAVLNPMNDMLKALNQERERRKQEQAQHAQHTNGKVVSEASTAQAVHPPGNSSPRRRPPGLNSKRKAPGSDVSQQAQQLKTVEEGQQDSATQQTSKSKVGNSHGPAQLTVLSYNLWFEEGVALEERMAGLADIILTHQPDLLLFQEVTHNMMKLWMQQHSWLGEHYSWTQPPPHAYFTLMAFKRDRLQLTLPEQRVPFDNSQMGRDVLSLGLSISNRPDVPAVLVATSHLESPLRDNKYLPVRKAQVISGQQLLQDRATQLEAALTERHKNQPSHATKVDVIWGGDTNWISAHSEAPPLRAGWQDVWSTVHPGQPGYTWDSTTNAMLQGTKLPACRMDRFFARLSSWQVASVELVGVQVLPGVKAQHYGKTVAVHVSDHYGVLLKLVCSPASTQ